MSKEDEQYKIKVRLKGDEKMFQFNDLIMDMKAEMEHKEKMQKICNQINSMPYIIKIGCGGLIYSKRYDIGSKNDDGDYVKIVRYTQYNLSERNYGFTIESNYGFNNHEYTTIYEIRKFNNAGLFLTDYIVYAED